MTSSTSERNRSANLLVAITFIIFGVFLSDLFTPLGYAVWILYFIPVTLTIQQTRLYLPYAVAFFAIGLQLAGYFLSSTGMAPEISAVNRILGATTCLGIASLVQRVIAQRLHAEHLMWLEQGRTEIGRTMLGEQTPHVVVSNTIDAVAQYVDAQVGLFYLLDQNQLIPMGGHAVDPLPQQRQSLGLGQGLTGQAAVSRKIMVVHDLPDDYLRIASSFGQTKPRHLIISPVTAEGQLIGVLELGFIQRDANIAKAAEMIGLVTDKIGIAVRSALYRERVQNLLEETQRQSEELQSQQEELRVTNEELTEQSRALQESQTILESQQNELEQSNVQLEERTQSLEQQKLQLLRTQQALEANAAELERSNKYKSEFLANMSHELRTPLNSSLILSHTLAENKNRNLTEDQVRYLRTIHAANTDLLTLINDILDLSKIEAGQVYVHQEPLAINDIVTPLKDTFIPISRQKSVEFDITVSSNLPATITTDMQRLQQILKNLLSNAFKFTQEGKVELEVSSPDAGSVRFAVRDTGIGIPLEKQEVIFEAFRQADGSTSRQYGGTGLGLSISRELTRLLGGSIDVTSEVGTGSTFALTLPVQYSVPETQPLGNINASKSNSRHAFTTGQTCVQHIASQTGAEPVPSAEQTHVTITDDRDQRRFGRSIMIVEDDEKFAGILCELVREKHFDCLHAPTAAAAMRLAQEARPDAILLDVGLPDESGLSVLEQLKRNADTRHIPVHMISVEEYKQTAFELGALGYALKPAARDDILAAVNKLEEQLSKDVQRVLIVEDSPSLRESLVELLKSENTEITTVGTGRQALEMLAERTFDCMVLDLLLPDATGYELLEAMSKSTAYSFPPVIVYTGRVLSRDEEDQLRRYSQSIIIKGARSPERLLDEVTLFLHRVESTLPDDKQLMLQKARQMDVAFEGRTFLLAEDDARNIFALKSVLEPLGATINIARNGKEALEALTSAHGIDLVLMDIMMPEMDGLTAIREIRKNPKHKNLPIVALTAKAMADDRQECLNAGANDYISKPIDVNKLISLCRIWLPK